MGFWTAMILPSGFTSVMNVFFTSGLSLIGTYRISQMFQRYFCFLIVLPRSCALPRTLKLESIHGAHLPACPFLEIKAWFQRPPVLRLVARLVRDGFMIL
jgi:hypothetical protein